MAKQKQNIGKPRDTQPSWFDRLSPLRKDFLLIGIMYVLLLILFNEIVFRDMIFADSGDSAAVEAWSKAMEHITTTDHVEPLWIPYIFSGMPLYGSMIFPRNVDYFFSRILLPVARIIFFNAQMHWMILPFLLMGAGMFFFARQLKFSHGASFLAGITMMLNPYAVGLPETGHGSKLVVLSIVPWLFFSIYKMFERRNIFWCGVVAVVTGTMLLNRHPQIAFYGLMVVGLYLVYEVILDIKSQARVIPLKIILFVVALGLGFAIYAYQYLPMDEYAQYSIRGTGGAGGGSGLDYEYATNWSFHPFEIMNYIIPSFFGLRFFGDKVDYYWGWMPFTNSTVYVGFVPLFLGILALIFKRNRFTWFLMIVGILMLFISFGKHLSIIFDLMFKFVPHFKQFRTPVMVLHLMPMIFGILAAYGFTFISELIQHAKEVDLVRIRKRLTAILIVIGALLLIGFALNGTVQGFLSGILFQKEGEFAQLKHQYGAEAVQAVSQLKQLRFDRLWEGYIYFAICAGCALGLIIGALRKKISMNILAVGLIVITIVDLWIFDAKYINPQPANALTEHFQADPTLEKLQAESEADVFRIFPSGRLDQENLMMYHHIQSVEGYCPAKLKIYQEVRDSCFGHGNMNVFSMLNVKYLVGQEEARDGSMQTVIQPNPNYLPRAWFVDSTVVSRSKEETFHYLNSPDWNPRVMAILEKDLPVKIHHVDSASASMTKYSSREITLSTSSPQVGLLVVSEIYYPAGWKAFVDGGETEIYKTNHILRSVLIPAGKHTVSFEFNPATYTMSYSITNISWGVAGILILVGVFQLPVVKQRLWKKRDGSQPAA
jgi:hypothetical protein